MKTVGWEVVGVHDNDEIEIDIRGEHGTIDPRAVAEAITALDKLVRNVVGEQPARLSLSKLAVGSAVIAVKADPQRVELIQEGLQVLRETSALPDGWSTETASALVELQRVAHRHGVDGVLLRTHDVSVPVDQQLASRAEAILRPPPPSLGSVRGLLHRYINHGSRRSAGLRDYRTGRAVDVTFPARLVPEVRAALDHEVEVWGDVYRDSRDRVREIRISGIEILDSSRAKVTLDDAAGILGPEWTGGLDPVEWVRRQRG